jgi:hypothetical protein
MEGDNANSAKESMPDQAIEGISNNARKDSKTKINSFIFKKKSFSNINSMG